MKICIWNDPRRCKSLFEDQVDLPYVVAAVVNSVLGAKLYPADEDYPCFSDHQ